MTFREYIGEVTRLAMYKNWDYPFLGLAEEAGEVIGKYAKFKRGDYGIEEFNERVKHELGDCLWMITACCNELGISLEQLAELNVKKLRDREKRDVLSGDGDNR